jgi:hypothetical protein
MNGDSSDLFGFFENLGLHRMAGQNRQCRRERQDGP